MADENNCVIPCERIKEVDDSLRKLTNTVSTFVAVTDLRVKRVEEGVSNYIKFMAEAQDFFTYARAKAETEEKFHNKRDEEIRDAANTAAFHIKTDLDERHEKADKRDRMFKWGMSFATLVVMVFMAWIAYREYERKITTVTIPAPIAHSVPQDSVNNPNSYATR